MNLISDLFGVPVAYASFDSFIASVNNHLLNPIIYLLFAVAMVVFLYGVVVFIANQSNESERANGKNHMLFGIIGLAIMFSVWALINIIINTFGLDEDVTPDSTSVDGTVHLREIDFEIPAMGPN